MCDVNSFVRIASKSKGKVHITDGEGFRVNGKSLLGVMYSLEFETLWCESEEDIYSQIEPFVVI